MDKTKSYEISKHAVWEAYKHVKANKGASGIDDVYFVKNMHKSVKLFIK